MQNHLRRRKRDQKDPAGSRFKAGVKGRHRVGELGTPSKVQILSGAIQRAIEARGTATIADGVRAGLSERETERLWNAAMDAAREADPALFAGIRS